ncbi:MAG: branched-chain amino acid ABC transporter permease [Gammaproteobacteria bacterium]|nr:branched-chain amino acid ABC transporter permease [Gammaproteobacteria bacterium]
MDISQLVVTGIANGCVYGLVALGFVLIYKATEMVNFAQGDIMMLGAFIAFTLSSQLEMPYYIVVPGTILIMAVFGMALERGVLRPMIGEPPFAVLMLTIGLGFVLRAIAGTIWGHQPNQLITPYSGGVIDIAGIRLDYEKLVIMGGTGVLCALMFLFFKFTRIGVAMQAASQNQLAAYYVGIPVNRVVSITWGISAAVAAAAALMVAPLWWIEPGLGLVGIKAFVAAIVGGFGSLPGALIGGIAIGLVEQLVGYTIPGFGETGAYVFLLLMLFIRPEGILATMQRKKV